jgi:GWxTD domain-containing protein
LNQDAVYIITDQERRTFLGLQSDALRETFVEQFWLRRDPTPDTAENEFKDEHYRRIAYANSHFSSDAIGWKADRGRVYITYGPPDEIDLHRVGPPFPTESWRYRFLSGVGAEVKIDFSDPDNSGEYRLSQSATEELRAISMASTVTSVSPWMESRTRTNGAPKPPPGTTPPKTILPMLVRVDYLRLTDSTTLTNVTIQFDNHDLRGELRNGSEIMLVNLAGQVATLEGKSVATFEKPYSWSVRRELLQQFSMQQIPVQPFSNRRSVLQQSFQLAPGRYRFRIVAKDAFADARNDFQTVLNVPGFTEDKLASSSLIVADTIERLPAGVFGEGAAFAIGETKVRPRIGNKFTSDEKMGIYLQLYNLLPDETTRKPTASVEYEISRAESNEQVMRFTEEVGRMPHSSAKQVTIEKILPLGRFVPGTYTLRIKVNDRSANTMSQQQQTFTIGSE